MARPRVSDLARMIPALVLALDLFGHYPIFGPPQTASVQRHTGGWDIELTRDLFTGDVACAIRKGPVQFQNDVLIFHLGPYEDTYAADFRIDGGPARSVREATYEDQRRGFFRNGGPLANPSDGEVALPSYYAANATRVWVRASPGHAPAAFDVSHFPEALTLARSMGCPGIGP
jgi:hypothetical protein